MSPRHPDPPSPEREPRVTIVDGNAIAGRLDGLFAVDATTLLVTCGICHAEGPLAGAVVELDDDAAIVRCRHCTHTLFTVLNTDAGPVLRIAALVEIGGSA